MKPTSPIVIYFLLLQCATTIQAQANTRLPTINTLYLPIGTLYPRSDFAGVIINLNVQDAITRGTAALQLTDTFLLHHSKKLQPKQWTGKFRSYQFIALNRKKVQQNLAILKADLYQVQARYRIPAPPKNTPNP